MGAVHSVERCGHLGKAAELGQGADIWKRRAKGKPSGKSWAEFKRIRKEEAEEVGRPWQHLGKIKKQFLKAAFLWCLSLSFSSCLGQFGAEVFGALVGLSVRSG